MTTSPITVSGLTSLPEARKILAEYQIRHLPVIDREDRLIGILTDRDLRSAYPSSVTTKQEAILAFDRVQQSSVEDIMTRECSTLTIEARLQDALKIFERDKVGAIPVVDEEMKVLGLFSLLDLTSAYGSLFGANEEGTFCCVLEDDGREDIFSEISQLCYANSIVLKGIMQIKSKKDMAKIYMRVNSLKPDKVLKLLHGQNFRLVTTQ